MCLCVCIGMIPIVLSWVAGDENRACYLMHMQMKLSEIAGYLVNFKRASSGLLFSFKQFLCLREMEKRVSFILIRACNNVYKNVMKLEAKNNPSYLSDEY